MTKRYIPEGYELSWSDEEMGIQIYYKDGPYIGGLCFVGRAVKPTWNYRFKNEGQRWEEVKKTFNRVGEKLERKESNKAKQAEALENHGVKVGDIFKSSWGYDQTNIDFYQVIAVTGKTATICAIGQLSEEDGFMSGKCVPAPGKFIGKPSKKRIQKMSVDSDAYFRINSCANAWKIVPIAVVGDVPVFEQSHWTAYA